MRFAATEGQTGSRATRERHTLADYLAAGLGKAPNVVVAERLGVTRQCVGIVAAHHGIECPDGHATPRPNPAAVARRLEKRASRVVAIRELAKRGLSAKQIAGKLRIDRGTVWNLSKAEGLGVAVQYKPQAWWAKYVDWSKDNRIIAGLVHKSVAFVCSTRWRLRKAGFNVPRAPWMSRGRRRQ